MIRKPIQAVSEFHKAFGLSIENKPTANISSDISNLRYNLMKEENEEYLEATKKNDLVEIKTPAGTKNFNFMMILNDFKFIFIP